MYLHKYWFDKTQVYFVSIDFLESGPEWLWVIRVTKMYATEEETETNVAYQALKSRVCYVVQTIVFSVAVSNIASKLQDLKIIEVFP